MKVFVQTWGCRANHYDSEVVRAMVTDGGGVVVSDPADADVAVFNSCAVTADAEADLRQGIRRWHREQPHGRAVVMGCAAARDEGQLALLPGVSHVIPGAALPEVALALGVEPGSGRTRAQLGSRAVLRIQDGCEEHCTFCATTMARGAHRSRPVAELVREARDLAVVHPEIVVTGTHIGSWGSEDGRTLGTLMQSLLNEVPGVRWRLSSIEATEVCPALQECLQHPAQLVPHLHAPLQSGSDRLLRRMGRHWYTAERYAAALLRIIGGREVFALGADLITGFPGETEEDHRATCALVRDLPFTYLHVFPYSERPGTAAVKLGPMVPAEVARARARELRAMAGEHERRYRQRRHGGLADVVVEGGPSPRGLSEDYLPVSLDTPRPRRTRAPARLHLLPDGSLRAEFLMPQPQ